MQVFCKSLTWMLENDITGACVACLNRPTRAASRETVHAADTAADLVRVRASADIIHETFCVIESHFGTEKEIPLKPGGADIDVTEVGRRASSFVPLA